MSEHAANGGIGAHATAADDGRDARERPIGELVKDLSPQTSTLVRKEIELAQAELQQKGKVAGKGAGMLVGAARCGLLALGALTAAPDRPARHGDGHVDRRADRDGAVGGRRPGARQGRPDGAQAAPRRRLPRPLKP